MVIFMSNVYDMANNLAFEIRKSKEYTEYKEARKKVQENPELKAKIDEFEKVRYEAQVLAIKAREEDKEKIHRQWKREMKMKRQRFGKVL